MCRWNKPFKQTDYSEIASKVWYDYNLQQLCWAGCAVVKVDVWVYLAVSLLALSAFGTPVSYACISILFYGHKEDRQEEIIHGEADRYQEKEKRRKRRYAAEAVILLEEVVCKEYGKER